MGTSAVTSDEVYPSRRQVNLKLARLLAAAVATGHCRAVPQPTGAHLAARPGIHRAGIRHGGGTPALDLDAGVAVSLPATTLDEQVPLIVLLHGAGGRGQRLLDQILAATGAVHAIVIAPTSRGRTWDALLPKSTTLFDVLAGSGPSGAFGPDVLALDRVLKRLFRGVAVDPAKIAIGGFSDGATYALALGLANGDLFSHVIALSPGFVPAVAPSGRPAVFVAHGRRDRMFPIDQSGRRISAILGGRGYVVRFREFDGGHEIADSIAREAVEWATASGHRGASP